MSQAPDEELVEVVHRVVGRPSRGGADNATMFWSEVGPDGQARVQFWIPDGDADRARLEAFWAACSALDWAAGDGEDEAPQPIHDVVALEPARPRWSLPTRPAEVPPPLDRPPIELTEAGLIRRASRPAAPVADSWRRIEIWLFDHCPEVLVQLQPGASAAQLDEFEAAIGRPLPADVRESWQIHDGMTFVPSEYEAMIRGDDDDDDDDDDSNEPCFVRSLIYQYRPEPLGKTRNYESILDSWSRFSDSDEPEPGRSATPPGAIRPAFSRQGWIPLSNEGVNRNNFIGVDLEPGPTGVAGQVIIFGRDERHQRVLALSWGQFLEDYADELEAGNFVLEPEDQNRRFLMKRPPAMSGDPGSYFSQHFDAWAEAKLPPGFGSEPHPNS